MNRSSLAGVARSNGLIVLIIFVFSFFCIGAFPVVGSGFDYWGFHEVLAQGVEAKAQVHILRETDGGYESDLRWIDQGGARRTARIALSKEYVLNNKARLKAEGVTVRYLLNNHWVRPVVIGDEDQPLSIIRIMLRFGIVLMLGSLAIGIFGLFIVWKVARFKRRAAVHISTSQSRAEAEKARKFVDRLPFETVTVPGHDAFATWERLKTEGRGYPVVLGNEQEAADLFRAHAKELHARMAAVAEVFKKAQGLRHPEDLQVKWQADALRSHETITSLAVKNPRFPVPKFTFIDALGRQTKQPDEDTRAWLLQEPEEDQLPLGEWPEGVESAAGLSVIRKIVPSELDGQRSYATQIKERVVVALLPVSRSHEVLGYLLYGNWNACPPAEYHVAAQRSWSERYGAEIVGVTGDTLNLRVARKPGTREEALKLAREHYIYCNDVIDQGAETLSNLAAQLMQHEWWLFWWD